ncbi:Pol I core factor CF [Monosporozyma unispora]|nr:Pol I core factor CF [Kazachstania unispora]
MSSTYIRGPVCGFDNCPSRLWRIIAGRRTCQYGHVMEGDIEFNNDDDAAIQQSQGVITKRLNLTTSQTGSFQTNLSLSQQNLLNPKQSKKLMKGQKATLLMIKCLQFILKRQVDYLIQRRQFPTQFEKIVKFIWLSFISKHNYHTRKMDRNDLSLNINITISVIYMAILQLGLPVYFCDLINWIASLDFPFYKASNIIPIKWNENLPNFYLLSLNGNNLLSLKTFTDTLFRFNSLTHITKFINTEINISGLVFKLITLTTLPLEFYFYTRHLVKIFCYKEDDYVIPIHSIINRAGSQHALLPETYIVLSFILTIRYIFLYDGMFTSTQIYSNEWMNALLQTPNLNEEDLSEFTINRKLTKLLNNNNHNNNSSNPMDWTEKETINYLNWMEEKFMPLEKQNHEDLGKLSMDERIIYRKLNDIIPLKSTELQLPQLDRHPLTFIEELQEKYLKLLDLIDNSQTTENNTNSTITTEKDEEKEFNERLNLICKLENKILSDLSNEFNVPIKRLKSDLSRFEKRISYIPH